METTGWTRPLARLGVATAVRGAMVQMSSIPRRVGADCGVMPR